MVVYNVKMNHWKSFYLYEYYRFNSHRNTSQVYGANPCQNCYESDAWCDIECPYYYKYKLRRKSYEAYH